MATNSVQRVTRELQARVARMREREDLVARRSSRSGVQRPARVHLSMNIDRELDRKMRAWSSVDGVSMASIVERALSREFAHRVFYRDAEDNREVESKVYLQRTGRTR